MRTPEREGADREEWDGDGEDGPRAAGDTPGEAVPATGGAAVGVADLGDERPEQAAAAQGEHGGQDEHGRDERAQESGRGGDAEDAGARDGGDEQGEEGEHDGDVRGEHRGSRVPECATQSEAVVRRAAQLLPVAGDEEQRVVRAGTEHEDARDAGRRAVQRQADGLVEVCGGDLRHAVGEADDDERHEPQDRRSVGDEQKHRDDGRGDEQEAQVGAGEGARGVGAERRAAGELHGQALEEVGAGGVADLVDRRRQLGAGAVVRDRDDRRRRLAVGRGDEGDSGGGGVGRGAAAGLRPALDGEHPVARVGRGGEVLTGERATVGAGEHGDRGSRGTVLELGGDLLHARRLGAGRAAVRTGAAVGCADREQPACQREADEQGEDGAPLARDESAERPPQAAIVGVGSVESCGVGPRGVGAS